MYHSLRSLTVLVSTVPGKTLQSPKVLSSLVSNNISLSQFSTPIPGLGMPCTQCMTTLVCCSFCMFEQRCPGWWNGITLALLPGKHFKTCFVHGKRCRSPVGHDDYKSFNTLMSWSPMAAGISLKGTNVSVVSSKISHAVRLPFPRKVDTVSQPVSAWINGKPSAFDIA